MTARKRRARSPRELDLMELLTRQRRSDTRVAHALVTVLCRADAPTLAAFGIVLRFVVRWAPRRQR
jgi:hypothetical protein